LLPYVGNDSRIRPIRREGDINRGSLRNTPVLGILRNDPANGFTLRLFGYRADHKTPFLEPSSGISAIRPDEPWHVDEPRSADG
jgi:hypothetical protein